MPPIFPTFTLVKRIPRPALIFAALVLALRLPAQEVGNAWIDYSRQHWHFSVIQDGLYRLSYAELQAAGFPVNADPDMFRVFGRGQEAHIAVVDGGDGTFGPGDYIEVYALHNDGFLDSLMYDHPSHQPHKAYSLFNDTASYFISAGANEGLRTGWSANNDFGNYNPAPWCWVTREAIFSDEYLFGNQDQFGIALPWYEEGEGWFDTKFSGGQTHQHTFNTAQAYTGPGAPEALVQTVFAGANRAAGSPNHHMQVAWGTTSNTVADVYYDNYALKRTAFNIPAASLAASTAIFHTVVDDIGIVIDYQSVAGITLRYARTLNLGNTGSLRFALENPDNAPFRLLEFTNYTGANPRLFILGNGAMTEVAVSVQDGVAKALVPFAGGDGLQELLFTTAPALSPGVIKPVSDNGFFTDYTAIPLDSAFVIITHPKLLNAATFSYKAHRSNQYPVLVANIDELYMQYAYGIRKHPIAIRRFCQHLMTAWESDPSHLFLLGKSIREMSVSANYGARNNPELYARNLVPTMGYPPSDNALTAVLGSNRAVPAIPTGRLAAENENQVLEYLNKIIEQEAQPPSLWQKRMMHFGGGSYAFEQQLLANYLASYETVAEDTCFGAEVFTFLKNTSEPIQLTLSDSVQQLIDGGVSLMTFFGHASSTGFDQNIDEPESYNNQGKYPMLIGNSCYTGNIHLPEGESTSENFVLVPNRGVIAFLAKPDLGRAEYLHYYTLAYYRHLFQTHYGCTIGQATLYASADTQVLTTPIDSMYRENMSLAMTLHGDPAVRLYPHEKPDYVVTPASITFDPEIVTAQVDSFTVHIEIENHGKSVRRPIGVELVRHYPGGIDSLYSAVADDVLNATTVSFTLPIDPFNGTGINTFDVFVDYPANLVSELNEVSNNLVTGKPLLITSGNLVPVWPFPFAVVPESDITLTASTGYALEAAQSYVIQVDTDPAFGSPLQTTVTQSGGVITWDLPFAATDSTVYFWRCSPDSTGPEAGWQWQNSSFQHIAGKEGWGQAHPAQFAKDDFIRIEQQPAEPTYIFSDTQVQLKCDLYGNPVTSGELLGTRYQLDLDVMEYSGCGLTPALMVAVIDSVSLVPWESNYNNTNPQHDYGNEMSCAEGRERPERYFIFLQNDEAQMDAFANMVENEVPDGNYLLVYSWNMATYDTWTPAVFDAFANLGATQIGLAQDSVPFIFFKKMGHENTITEIYGTQSDDYLVLETPLTGVLGKGEIRSVNIGPALAWSSASWQFDNIDAGAGDSAVVRINGISAQQSETPLTQLPGLTGVYEDLAGLVNAGDAVKLRLDGLLTDTVNATPPQPRRWHVLYEEVPDCAVDPHSGFYFSADTADRGDQLHVAVAIRNISPTAMDSLLVRYWVEDAAQGIQQIPYPRQAPLPPGEVLLDTLSFSTAALEGLCMFWMEVNPVNGPDGLYDQPEMHHFNNILQYPFTVAGDRINPILDVTFDGQHILNGDIVSAEPHILITLDDENPYFIMNEEADTANFRVYLTTPQAFDVPVYFNTGALQWTPANSVKNVFRIDYQPVLALDGRYSLRVQASDKSGNASASIDYRIEFEVITRPTITEVLNYPNPFSTRTHFVFTLTGTDTPDEMKIQIMTIGGNIVREITQAELGPLHIGRNMTEFTWDGRDEYGDQLANGVYLYRVVARLNGQALEVRDSGASRYITKGFGKMYLMR